MNKADTYLYELMKRILAEGYKDKNPRPKYQDGTPAHTLSVNGNFRIYDIGAGEFPLTTLRPIAVKTGIREILAIFQNQSNKISEFERMGCSWWKDWALEDGTIGRAYPYNMESHRPGQMERETVHVHKKTVNSEMAVPYPDRPDELSYGIGYYGNFESVKNFTDEDRRKLFGVWSEMLRSCQDQKDVFVHRDWHCFERFLKDIRYIPQYFLARESEFIGWRLSISYYDSNCFSKDTCVFLPVMEDNAYEEENKNNGHRKNTLRRKELSRNQVVELLNGLKKDPYGRRHIVSFWNWANIDKKALVECAYETIWNVRNKDGEEYLDMHLIQRSGDSLTASCSGVNESQYASLLMMVSKHCGYKPGMFYHLVANEQIYDRHISQAKEIMERYEATKLQESLYGPKKTPKMLFDPELDDFFQFTAEDFTVVDYDPIKPQLKLDLGI